MLFFIILVFMAAMILFAAGSDNSQCNNKAHAIAWIWLEGASGFFSEAISASFFVLSDGKWSIFALEMDKKIKWFVGELSSATHEMISTCPPIEWAKGLLDLYRETYPPAPEVAPIKTKKDGVV